VNAAHGRFLPLPTPIIAGDARIASIACGLERRRLKCRPMPMAIPARDTDQHHGRVGHKAAGSVSEFSTLDGRSIIFL